MIDAGDTAMLSLTRGKPLRKCTSLSLLNSEIIEMGIYFNYEQNPFNIFREGVYLE